MKKLLTIVLILLMMIQPLAVFAEAAPVEESQETEAVEQIVIDYDYDHLVVGNTTPFSGGFFTSMWGAATSDLDVQKLVHGYNLVKWRSEYGAYDIDPSVVSGIVVTENAAGNRTYTFEIYDDLYYSDGSKITAKDYAFCWLISMAPQIAEIGGNVKPMDYLVGYREYVSGRAPYLAGVRLIDDYTIAISIDKAYLPFFYEMALLDCQPYPISVIAPGCRVADDGKGVYIANKNANAVTPVFNATLLRSTLLDETNGYLSHPYLGCGPYVMKSYDGKTVELELNTYYKGDDAGIKPTIHYLTYKTVAHDDMVEALASGAVGLLNKCVNATVVDEALKLVNEQDIFTKTDYPRSGLSYIAFCTERTAVNSVSVRQAIAMCMNKDGFVNDTVGDYGLRADGYYGVGQWMYTMVNATDSSEYPIEKPENGKITQQEHDKLVAEWEALSLDDVQVYDFDVDAAVALLEADGWTLNRDGKAYESGKDDVRCKTVDGVVTPLSLKMLVPAESNIDEAMEKNFAANLAQMGIQLTVEAQPMAEMLKSFYRRIDRDCDMIYLASNFGVVFDPTANFRPDSEDGVNMSNFTALDDSLLYNLAVAMRQTEPGDLLGYCKKWINFQIRLQEIEPIIPLYSGVYYDFYPQVLQNYNINSNATWSEAVIEAYMGDVMD